MSKSYNVTDNSFAISPCESNAGHYKHDWVEVHDNNPTAYLKHCDGVGFIDEFLYAAILDIIGSGLMDETGMSEKPAFEIARGLTDSVAEQISHSMKENE